MNKMIPSINYHLWKPCNAKCKFCFAKFDETKDFLPKGHLSKEESLKLIDEIIKTGVSKITFAGGEPTLCPWLPDLIKRAKLGGLTTMITTNGLTLSDKYLEKLKDYLDWITISIDSINANTNLKIGRHTQTLVPDEIYYRMLISKIKKNGFNLKINTVISKLNYLERLDGFIISTHPTRWKIFQVLPIKGQNAKEIKKLEITKSEFDLFINNHKNLNKLGIDIVSEKNDDMINSYLMIDPAGRFYDNSKNFYFYSSPILQVGINKAYSQININYKKFINRNGLYNWSTNKCNISDFYALEEGA